MTEHIREVGPRASESPQRTTDAPDRAAKVVRPLASEPQRVIESPYLTAHEAARYLRFPHVRALYAAIAHGLDVPVSRRGRTLLFHRERLDRWLAGAPRVHLLREARRRS